MFREIQVYGYHPREQTECAFDIVTPYKGNFISDAEVLFVAEEILREFPTFQNDSSYFFRINHTSLLRGIMVNCGINEELHDEVYKIIRCGTGWSNKQKIFQLNELGLTDSVVNNFLGILDREGSTSTIRGILRYLTRKKNPASLDIKQGLDELDAIISRAQDMGIRNQIVVSPGLVYNPGHFSGMVCHLVVRRKKKGFEVIGAGGRYDQLVNTYAANFSLGRLESGSSSSISNREISQCAVGISLSLDRLSVYVSADLESLHSVIDVLIYSENKNLLKEMLDLASRLWKNSIRCEVCDTFEPLDDVQNRAMTLSASYIVILRDTDGFARLRSLDRDRFIEKKIHLLDLVEHLQRQLQQNDPGDAGLASGSTGTMMLHRMESSKLNPAEQVNSISKGQMSVQVNYNYRFFDKSKNSSISKKRLEATISAKITSTLSLIAPNTNVEVLVLPLPTIVIKSIHAILNFEDETTFEQSVDTLIEKHIRYKKDLTNICDEIQGLKFEKDCSVFFLYSFEDHEFSTVLAN